MTISLIALNISGDEAVQSAAERLEELLAVYGACTLRPCENMQQVSASLNEAFADADVIVVGVEPSAFAKAKLSVLRAMRIKTELNNEIREALSADPELDSQRIATHAAVPVDSTVFLSETGFCSGFALRSGDQIFIMLPLETQAAEAMMQDGVEPYCAENGIEKAPEEISQTAIDLPQVQTLRDLNKKVYFAAAPSLDQFRELYGPGNEDVFVFDSYTSERNGESPKSYLADLARYAIPQGESNAFGAAISNVFTGVSRSGEQRFNVYIALSDGSSSRVIRFLSQPGETPEQLMKAAYEMLLDMIEEKCIDEHNSELSGAAGDDGQEIVEDESPNQKKARRQNGVTAIVFAVLSLLIALAVLLFYWGMDNAEKNSAKAKKVLEQNTAVQQTEENTDIASWFQVQSLQENAEAAEDVAAVQ